MKDEFSFMNEKIKEKPFYKKKWVKMVGVTIALGALFGAIASTVFVHISDWMQDKKQQESMTDIEIPMDSEDESEATETVETITETILVEGPITIEDYTVLYAGFRGLAKEVQKSIVTVTALRNDVDWFNESYQNQGQSFGMIIGDNGVELLVMAKYANIESCDGIHVTFADSTVATAVLKKYDKTTGLAILSVNLSDIAETTKEKITKAAFGNSMRLEAGTPVIALGRVDGSENSMKIGTLTSTQNKQSVVDAEYTILVTDMLKNAGADGVLINLQGEIVGIVQNQYISESVEQVLTAYGISDMKSLLEHLSNNQDITYLGFKGISVTEEAKQTGVPDGIFVTDVNVDSPAMKGGIQSGDIIQSINGQPITKMSQLADVLSRLSNRQSVTLEGQRLTKDGYKKTDYQTFLSVLE